MTSAKDYHVQTIPVNAKNEGEGMSPCFSLFIDKLSNNLKQPLPGRAAHQDMEALSAGYLKLKPNPQTRRSAVMLLLYPVNHKIYFPLILRSRYDGFHSGEVGFPGGRYEISDENLIRTALRETGEEIGVKADEINVLGVLTETFIAVSNFLILPVIGYIPYRPEFLPDTREVGHIFEVDLSYISDPAIIGLSEIEIPGYQILTPYYQVEGHMVWGATAKIIRELLSVLNTEL